MLEHGGCLVWASHGFEEVSGNILSLSVPWIPWVDLMIWTREWICRLISTLGQWTVNALSLQNLVQLHTEHAYKA